VLFGQESITMESRKADDLLEWLQAWYECQCDGDWEHQYGVRIDTLDNPGWLVTFNLKGTPLEGQVFSRVRIDKSGSDWIHYRAENDSFEGAGGPGNLIALLQSFRDWVESLTPYGGLRQG
jgi:hypothetical protein